MCLHVSIAVLELLFFFNSTSRTRTLKMPLQIGIMVSNCNNSCLTFLIYGFNTDDDDDNAIPK